MGISDHGTTYSPWEVGGEGYPEEDLVALREDAVPHAQQRLLRESGPLQVVHLSRHKWPGRLVNVFQKVQLNIEHRAFRS
jgi:hypothetical protein